MTNTSTYHYVYRITNLVENKHYYGKRSSHIDPKLDIGFKYFSSSKDKEFRHDQKINPSHYRYKVIRLFSTANEACLYESKLHYKFNVGQNPSFYNRIIQTANGFDSSGMVSVKDKNGINFTVSNTDPRYLTGELVGCTTGIPCSNAQKIAISKTLKGRIFTVEEREKLSKASLGKPKTREHAAKISFRTKNQMWVHNKLLNKELAIQRGSEILPGWELGRLIGSCTGLKWIYNETLNERTMISRELPLPSGWRLGRGKIFRSCGRK